MPTYPSVLLMRPNDLRFSCEPRARRHVVNELNIGPRGSSAASAG